MRLACRHFAVVMVGWAGFLPVAHGQSATDAKVAAWATGGASATARPADPAAGPGGSMPYWQAPALPAAVIQGGTIPAGWRPQAIPYQGIGPDGRVITQYFAPTYTFTYQAGPPVLAVPQPPAVNRRQPPAYRSPQAYGTAPAAYVPGWNYQAQGMPPVTGAPAAPTVARYAPAPAPVATPAWGPSVPVSPPVPATAAPSGGWAAVAAPATAAAAAAAANPTAPLAPVPAPADAAPGMQAVPGPAAAPRPRLWRVIGVQDGDTVTCLDDLNQEQKVALADVDAPEIGQEYGKTSREALAGMVFGRTVEAGTLGTDASGGMTARLFVDGVDVSRQMVATGNAWQDPASPDRSLATEQAQARAAQLGLWSGGSPTPPWEYRAAGRQ